MRKIPFKPDQKQQPVNFVGYGVSIVVLIGIAGGLWYLIYMYY